MDPTTGDHDCETSKCAVHECQGMASSTVRQIHSVLSGVLNAAVRWDVHARWMRVAFTPFVYGAQVSQLGMSRQVTT